MTGFTLAAVAGVAAGLMIGAAATVGVTLTLDVTADHGRAPTQIAPAARSLSVPYPVQYGDRCWHGHCIPWP
ncbi:hypothetical protein AWC05_23060 [Mycobacterium florentinum]|uniref:DUF2613 domain-containing protein n=1 Tax=Mycobacterium florentinum TaxID=292462 RepID=A0A1X1U6C7_MYCFL|nr:hypothetical protein [Mycobacterium florentinum]MCV7409977.1 hypothetical protein [Mycobacterium florentinum]ORV52386.1 hypothetical protein AWC05_23060 [Mycobacterium florentinum]BBX79281.1 hypothetical protein MFLOJ_30680 [Mycobacterium florentinum]